MNKPRDLIPVGNLWKSLYATVKFVAAPRMGREASMANPAPVRRTMVKEILRNTAVCLGCPASVSGEEDAGLWAIRHAHATGHAVDVLNNYRVSPSEG